MQWVLVGLAILAGLSNPVQSASNAGLNKAVGVVPAALIIYLVALAGLACAAPFLGVSLRDFPHRVAAAPWWVWVGGLCNLMFVLAAALTTQRIGSAVFTVTAACCAVVVSIVLDRFGVLGLHPHPINLLRVLGGGLAVAGIVLVSIS